MQPRRVAHLRHRHVNAPLLPFPQRYILDRLRDVYCGSVGYEYMHIPDRAQCNWVSPAGCGRPGPSLATGNW